MPRKRKEVEEEEGVTRCVCGHEELQNYATKQRGVDPSLFIQCDQCEVWQHGYCVGLAARDVPEVYYCEECRPEFHDVKTKNGRTTSRYTPQSRQSGQRREQSSESDGEEDSQPRDRRKRRQTMNSREDDILQRVLEQSAREAELLKREKHPKHESDSVSDQEEAAEQEGGDDGDNEAEDPKQESNEGNEAGDGSSNNEAGNDTDADAEVEAEAEAEAEVEAEVEAEQEQEQEHGTLAKEEEEDEQVKQVTPPPKRKRRPRGRPGPKVAKNASNAVNGKKCKPKIPSARATFTEMRKRVALILEFSGHTQSEMISEDEFRKNMLQEQQGLENNESVVSQVETLYLQHKQNITQLEGLTAKLLAWQEKYG